MADPAETRSLVARWIEARNAGSIGQALQLVSDDVVHDPNQSARTVGREALERHLIHAARCYEETRSDLVVLVSEDGQRAAAEYTVRGIYRETDDGLPPASGQSYSLAAASFFEIDDGRISRISTWYNLQDLIAQLGR